MPPINLKDSLRTGITFGLTSATITTLGLMIGLFSATNSKLAVIGGVITIAIADAMSDALGIHLAEESENQHSHQEVWASTFFTFLAKLIFGLTFIPWLLFSLPLGIYLSLIWGALLLTITSWKIAKFQNKKSYKIILEHLSITILVIILANLVGKSIDKIF